MSLDALHREILDEARRKSGAIEAQAGKEADAILKEARARARAVDEAFERELKEEIGRISLEYLSAREMQERNILLSARERRIDGLVERVRGAVMKRVRERGYKRLFDSAIREALKVSPAEGLTLVMDRQDARFAKGFPGKVRYAKMDGLVIYAAEGRIKIDATLGKLFDRDRDLVKEAIRNGVFGTPRAAAAKKRPAGKAAKKRVPRPRKRRHRR